MGDVLTGLLGGLLGGVPKITVTLRNSSNTALQTFEFESGDAANIFFGPDSLLYLKLKVTANNVSKVSVKLTSAGLFGLVEADVYLRVHEVFKLETSDDCAPLMLSTFDAEGATLTLLQNHHEPVLNPSYAIDNNPATYSQIGYNGTISLSLATTISQEFRFPQVSEPGEQPVIVFSRDASVLNLDLLNSIQIQVYNGSSSVYTGTAAGLLGLDALALLSAVLGTSEPYRITIPVTAPYDRIVISYSQLLGLGIVAHALRIYDVKSGPVVPELSSLSYAGCEGSSTIISVTNYAPGVTYQWYNSELNVIHEGANLPYNFPAAGQTDTLLVRAIDECGTPSAYQPMIVRGFYTPPGASISSSSFE